MCAFFAVGSSVTGKPLGAYSDVLARCEISRVLLLMLLQVNSALYCTIYVRCWINFDYFILYLLYTCSIRYSFKHSSKFSKDFA